MSQEREERLRVMVLPVGETAWRVWKRSPLTPQRAWDEAVEVAKLPSIADVRIDRTVTIREQLTVEQLHAELVERPAIYREMT